MSYTSATRNDAELEWVKSSYSSGEHDSDCVEVARTPGTVLIRDSKTPEGQRMAVKADTWTIFISYASGR